MLLTQPVRDAFAGRAVLVSGGLGFIGSNVARVLVELGAKVTVLDNLAHGCGGNRFNVEDIQARLEILEHDQADAAFMASLAPRFDQVFNLVGRVSHVDSMAAPLDDLHTNVTAQLGLLEGFRRANPRAKILYAGTRGQYGRTGGAPTTEDGAIDPVDVNGIHKHTGEQLHLLYARTYGLRVCSLRLTNTYGPRATMHSPKNGVFPWFVRQALDGEEIKLFGGGAQVRDWSHVDDVVRAMLMAMALPAADNQVFNIGSGAPVSLAEVAELIVAAAGSGSVAKIPYPPEHQSIEVGDYVADISKAARVLGWRPAVDLAAGLAQTIEYYRSRRDHYWSRGSGA
jgi:nucleoside-diphosphate-sugar epimerase